MSQPRNSTDTQALLQSMLQRLKLHPGREDLHTPVPATPASTWGQDGGRGASNLQKVNNSPVNGFVFGANGIPSKEFGISAADSNIDLKGGEIQQPGRGCEVDSGLISLPTQKDNTEGDLGENRVLGPATKPWITTTGTRQLFPAKSLKDADTTSFERTDKGRVSFGSSVMTRHTPDKHTVTSMGQNLDQEQSFTPRVYAWSPKANLDTGRQEDKVLHMGNGGFGALAQSKDINIAPTDKNTTSSSSRRKPRSSENKARRWTQKIKERWRDRPGSIAKKGKEDEQRKGQNNEQRTETSPQNQLLTAETLINPSNKEKERTLPSLDSSDPSKTSLTHTGASNAGNMRSTSDFEFGLGSFSLLDEIVTGQEWAKFLNPNQSATPGNQTSSEELKIPPNPHDSRQSSVILNQWSFRGTEASSVSHPNMAQISPFPPASMNVSEGKQQQADPSEPMEHGQTQPDIQSGQSGLGQKLRPPSILQPADILNNAMLKSRVHLNRKRHHQSAERKDERLQTEASKEAVRGRSTSSLSPTSSHVMVETGQSQHDSAMPLYNPDSPQPLSPSSSSPFSHAPKGVLKHSISQDSESSVEILSKRRRVEENRRVRFSEQVVTIVPPELDLDSTDPEEDSAAEVDSMIEQESEVEQAAIEGTAPARRPVLPAWIHALKRRNTGRKHKE